jgi:hypothetical protein
MSDRLPQRNVLPQWRKRAWAMVIWTVVAVAAVFVLHSTLLAPDSCPPNADPYCGFGEGAENAALGVFYMLLFLAWLAGLGVIWFVAWLIGDELPHRREFREIAKRRESESPW